MSRKISLLALGLALAGASLVAASDWEVDGAHSEVSFTVDHFFTPVRGSFADFDAELAYDAADPAKSSVKATIQVASIDTDNERRDNHLQSADFFEAATHPTMTFESTSVEKVGENELVAHGKLTIKGITKEVDLAVEVLGVKEVPEQMQGMFGARRASFRARTTIDRGDFEVGTGSWAATLVVGGEVEIEILVEASQ